MPQIVLETLIRASAEICYDLSLSVELHQLSTAQTKEHIVAGVKQGIMKQREFVTWRARHFGLWLELTSMITEAQRPNYFVDEMQKGPFQSLRHEHYFAKTIEGVIMKDIFIFESPLGFLGKMVNTLVIERYLKQFLVERNQFIKSTAESGRWVEILNNIEA